MAVEASNSNGKML